LSVAARATMFRPELVESIFLIDSLGGIASRPRIVPACR
jgi:hypothetical protein